MEEYDKNMAMLIIYICN